MAVQIIYNSIRYESLSSLVESQAAAGISYACVASRISNGWPLQKALTEPMQQHLVREYQVGELTFSSLKELSKAAGITYEAAVKRVHRGWTDFEIFFGKAKIKRNVPLKQNRLRGVSVIIAGISYENIRHAHDVLKPSCSFNALRARIRNGWTFEEALEVVKKLDGRKSKGNVKRLLVDGRYINALEASKEFGVPYSTVLDRLSRGATSQQAIGLSEIAPGELVSQADAYKNRRTINRREFIVDGKKFNSVKSLAEAYGLSARLVYGRIRDNGWSAARAVSEKVGSPVSGGGVTYKSSMNAWEKVGVTTFSTYQGRKAAGLPLDVCLGLQPMPAQERYEIGDDRYSSLAEVALAYGLTSGQLSSRLNSMSLEEAVIYKPSNGRYSESVFERDPELASSIGVLYFGRIKFPDGVLHKIGITRKAAAQRLQSYEHSIIKEVSGKLSDLYLIEQRVVRKFSNLHYRAENEFEGRTETFLLTDDEECEVSEFIDYCAR